MFSISLLLLAISSEMEMHEDPSLSPTPLLNKHVRKYITVEQWQLAINYGLCNHESGDDVGRKQEWCAYFDGSFNCNH